MRTTSDPKTWSMSDTRWSPAGKSFSFHMSSGAIGKSLRFLFVADPNGKNIRFMAEKEWGEKPIHDGWYDETGLFGHDDRHFNDLLIEKQSTSLLTLADFAMKVWNLDGSVRISNLAPPGCHGSVSSDKRWAASESWYTTDPIEFNVYSLSKKGGYQIFRTTNVNVVWELLAHINPVFSRDSKRLYFNHPVASNRSEIYWADLSNL